MLTVYVYMSVYVHVHINRKPYTLNLEVDIANALDTHAIDAHKPAHEHAPVAFRHGQQGKRQPSLSNSLSNI